MPLMGKIQCERHDLVRTDWLQTPQRTRSLSYEHVYSNGTVRQGNPVRELCKVSKLN